MAVFLTLLPVDMIYNFCFAGGGRDTPHTHAWLVEMSPAGWEQYLAALHRNRRVAWVCIR